ncbi:MAG: DUF6056 family protein [Alistipes sp.]|nr:DUF6056 family protein [Alistipes sp.]
MKKYAKKIMEWRVIPVLLSVTLFLRKFIPLWRLAAYDHSNADDFWMSVSTHLVWKDTHSVFAAVAEAWNSACQLWQNWDGCFLSMFLTCLSPVVFHESYYKYTFYIVGIAVVIGVGLFLYELCVRALGFSVSHFLIICPLVLTALFNFSPSAKEGLYWWCGAINYTFFFAVFMLSQALLIEYMVSGRIVWLVFATSAAFCVGLGNLLTALVSPLVVCLEAAVFLTVKKEKDWKFLAAAAGAAAGLLVNVLAPGNLVRGGSGLFHRSPLGAVLETIRVSSQLLVQGYKKPMFWIVLAILFAVWDGFGRSGRKFRFPLPGIVIALSYLVYCAALTPVIYAGSAIYGRCKDISFFILVIIAVCDIIYMVGWAERYFTEKKRSGVRQGLLYAGLLAVFWFSTVYRIYFDAAYAKDAIRTQTAQKFHDVVNARFAMYYDDDYKIVEIKQPESVPALFYFDDDSLGEVAYYFGKEEIILTE